MKNEKSTYEELEHEIFQLQKEIFELKSKQNISVEKLDLEPNILDKILDISPIGISYVDESGKVVYSNKIAEKIFRLPKLKLLEMEATSATWQATTLDGKPFPDEELPFSRVKNTKKPIFNIEHAIEYQGQKKVISVSAAPLLNITNDFIGMIAVVEDITDRKNAENEIRKSEEKYRLLFAENPQPMWIYDLETLAFLEVNQAAINHYGYSLEEFLSMTLKDIRPVDDIPALMDNVKNIRGNLTLSGEWRHIKKNGEIIVVEITSHSLISKNRHARHVLINDITENKRSQLDYQIMIKTSKDGFWIVDAITGKFLDVNQSYCDMIGYSRDEILQMTIQDVDAIETSEETKKHIERIKELGFDSFETKHKTKSGKIIDVDASVTFISFNGNKFFVSVKDISERKRAESEILKLSQAVEQSPVSVMITNLMGNIEYVNPKFVELTGYSSNEIEGKNPRFLNSGELPKEEYKKMWDTILSGKVWRGEFHNKKKNGELFWESASISTLTDNNGTMKYFLAVKEDITILKKSYEDLVFAKNKAQESDRLKSAFLANMSHEIRTPMNGILGFAGLLKESELSGEQQQEYINIIEKSGERMLNIINDIVSISKIESGIMDIHLSEMNVNNQLEFIYNSMKLDADRKNLTLSFTNALPDKEAVIKTDSEKFYSIISNLVKNAIKYTIKGNIEFGYHLKTVSETEVLEFFIKDTGIGIPKDRQEAIFERFIQADIEDKMARQGAGLGLAISRAYVKMLNGKMWLESKPNFGSTFYFTIPYNSKTKQKPVKKNLSYDWEDKTQLELFKVLIVEDDETSVALMLKMVSKLSKEVLTAKNGLDAINLCRLNPDIDLILIDIQMPVMNGYNATKQIRQFNKDVIIIAQTAFALSGDKENSLVAGCNDYISKPINREKLTEIIFKHLKNK